MDIFIVKDKTGREIRFSHERLKHVLRHSHMHEYREEIRHTLKEPLTIRVEEEKENVIYFYREYKERDPAERYLLVAVKYLNGNGFIITSFFTNRITGRPWKKN